MNAVWPLVFAVVFAVGVAVGEWQAGARHRHQTDAPDPESFRQGWTAGAAAARAEHVADLELARSLMAAITVDDRDPTPAHGIRRPEVPS